MNNKNKVIYFSPGGERPRNGVAGEAGHGRGSLGHCRVFQRFSSGEGAEIHGSRISSRTNTVNKTWRGRRGGEGGGPRQCMCTSRFGKFSESYRSFYMNSPNLTNDLLFLQ